MPACQVPGPYFGILVTNRVSGLWQGGPGPLMEVPHTTALNIEAPLSNPSPDTPDHQSPDPLSFKVPTGLLLILLGTLGFMAAFGQMLSYIFYINNWLSVVLSLLQLLATLVVVGAGAMMLMRRSVAERLSTRAGLVGTVALLALDLAGSFVMNGTASGALMPSLTAVPIFILLGVGHFRSRHLLPPRMPKPGKSAQATPPDQSQEPAATAPAASRANQAIPAKKAGSPAPQGKPAGPATKAQPATSVAKSGPVTSANPINKAKAAGTASKAAKAKSANQAKAATAKRPAPARQAAKPATGTNAKQAAASGKPRPAAKSQPRK